MPKVVIDDVRGLVQEGGSGIDIRSKGTKGVLKRRYTLVDETSADLVFSLPAGAAITDVFLVAHAAIRTKNDHANDTLKLGVGTDDPGTNIVAAATLIARNAATTAGEAAILSAGTKIEGAAGSALAFADAAVLYSAVGRNVNVTVDVPRTLQVGGDVTVGIEYTVL